MAGKWRGGVESDGSFCVVDLSFELGRGEKKIFWVDLLLDGIQIRFW